MHLMPLPDLGAGAHGAARRDLPSWTKTLPEDDVLLALAQVQAGISIAGWRNACDRSLPHASATRRREVLTYILRGLLDTDGTNILPSRFLETLRKLGAQGQRELVWARYVFGNPLVAAALAEVVAPIAVLLDEPLVATERLQVSTAQWQDWLEHRLKPGASAKSAINTRGNLLTALRRVGIVVQRSPGARTTLIRRATPEPLAAAWLVAHELRRARRVEVPERWASTDSFAVQLFLPSAAHMQVCIDQGIDAGLLHRSYLAGEPRLLLPEEA